MAASKEGARIGIRAIPRNNQRKGIRVLVSAYPYTNAITSTIRATEMATVKLFVIEEKSAGVSKYSRKFCKPTYLPSMSSRLFESRV